MEVLHRLTDLGNTILIIEHNLDVIRSADWIVDLGPEGGKDGGEIVAEGTPTQVAANPASYTGKFLRRYFPQAAPAKKPQQNRFASAKNGRASARKKIKL
jgi:excinuclease ABC subunit A